MATQIKVGIDNEEIILEGAEAQNLLNLQKEIQKDQTASEQAAQDRIDSLKVSYDKFIAMGFTESEAKVIFSGLGLNEEETKLPTS
jgi:hypothetical protein